MIQNRLSAAQRETVGAVVIVFAYGLLAGINAAAFVDILRTGAAWGWLVLNGALTVVMLAGGTWEAMRYRDARRRRKANGAPTG